MNAVNRAVLSFDSNTGEVVRLTIPRANVETNGDQARAMMEAIISGGAVTTRNGVPTGVLGAQILSTNRVTIV